MNVSKSMVALCLAGSLSIGLLGMNGGAWADSSRKAEAPAVESPSLGAPTQKEWTFKTAKAGTYTIKFQYARSFEKGVSAMETVYYRVQVAGSAYSGKEQVTLAPNKTTVVKPGQVFKVSQTENTTTGYSWTYKTSNSAIKLLDVKEIEQEEHVKKVAVGEKVSITLEENRTTGFSWSYKTDDTALKLVDEKEVNPATEEGLVGTPSQHTWTFEASKKGTYKLTFQYSQPWEKETPPAETVTYEIVVN